MVDVDNEVDIQERAIQLLAETDKNDAEVAAQIGVTRATVSRWKKQGGFMTRVFQRVQGSATTDTPVHAFPDQLFPAGTVTVTLGAAAALERTGRTREEVLAPHCQGKHGDIPRQLLGHNALALRTRGTIVSAYGASPRSSDGWGTQQSIRLMAVTDLTGRTTTISLQTEWEAAQRRAPLHPTIQALADEAARLDRERSALEANTLQGELDQARQAEAAARRQLGGSSIR